MSVPKAVNPQWKQANSNKVLNIEAMFVLLDDIHGYSGKDAPFVVMADGVHYRTPKCLWKQGREALEHLHCYKAPDLGRATLAQWLESVMESQELLEEDEEEEMEEVEEVETVETIEQPKH